MHFLIIYQRQNTIFRNIRFVRRKDFNVKLEKKFQDGRLSLGTKSGTETAGAMLRERNVVRVGDAHAIMRFEEPHLSGLYS